MALGQAIDRHSGGGTTRRSTRRRRRHRWPFWTAITLGTVAVLIIAAVIADYYYLGSLVGRTQVNNEQTEHGGAVNVLLVGSTTRCGIHQNPAYGLCASGVNGVNSDIVMVAHLANGKASLLSIPRDLFEPNARSGAQAYKIDAALYQGPSQLAAAIEEDFGIPINHYIELNFDTFASVVDAVGGINMYFPMRVYDAYSGLNIERPACYHLDGVHALQVVRARHLQIGWPSAGSDPHSWPNESLSDLARIRRTHEFLRVVAAKIASETSGLGGVLSFTDQSLATKLLPDLTVDNAFSEGEMVSLASGYRGTNIGTTPQLTYPVLVVYSPNGYIYHGYSYGDVEFPVQPGGWQTVDTIFGVKPGFSPWSGKPLPKRSGFHISVVNGSGVYGQQATVAAGLVHKGYVVTQTGVRTPVGPTSETVVWYGGPPPPKNGNWNSASLEAALRVVTDLEGPVTLGYDPAMVTPHDMVTVQTGTDVSVATRDWTAVTTTTRPPASTSSSSTTTSHPTTSTTHPVTATTVVDPPGVASDNQFSAPSQTGTPLQRWDPRACRANTKIILVDRSGGG